MASVPGDGTPKKVDVDKMHAYRDAIRDPNEHRVVSHAATLYPGISVDYGEAIRAMRMYPGEDSAAKAAVSKRVSRLLGG